MEDKYIRILMKEISKALRKDEVPVAALIVENETGKIVAKAFNKREDSFLTIDHAEIICISRANKCLKNKILSNCDLYVTLEPCSMCKEIIKESRIRNVYYLLERDITKKSYSKTNFRKWTGFDENKIRYQEILTNFFKKRR